MRPRTCLPALLVGVMMTNTAAETAAQEPPRPRANPVELENHGVTRIDEYYWLRNREDPAVIAHLEAENAWTRSKLAGTEELQERIFEEITGRIPQQDASAPVRLRGWWYQVRYEEEQEYPVHVRMKGSPDAPAELLLDGNIRAEGHDFYSASVGPRGVTDDGRYLAVAEDTVGRRMYTIRFRDLESGLWLPDEIPSTTSNFAWAADSRTLFYVKQDPETLRWDRVYRHRLGSDPAEDVLVFEESDETFSCWVGRSKSGRYLWIGSSQTLATEIRFLDAFQPDGDFRVILPRQRDHEYSVEHDGDAWLLRTNLEAENFRLVRAPIDDPRPENWSEIIPGREEVLLEDFELVRDAIAVQERRDGLVKLRMLDRSGSLDHEIVLDDETYVAWLGTNLEPDSRVLRYGYSSLTTPTSQYDYDLDTRTRVLVKRTEVVGGYDSSHYASRRIRAPARDGEMVPVSIVYNRELGDDLSERPLLLYGYGSYGASMDAWFDATRLSLLDRGFVYAIAHIRGGEELGRRWYEEGKLLRKKNTFNDFIDSAEHLVSSGFAAPDRLFAMGGSAGGLLVGAVLNQRPELWKGAIAAVPFVDVVTTMLDPSIPLTTSEYDEWGNPEDPEYFEYMLSYSPYDNVKETEYPALLVTTGLHDSQVQYWEPAKWVARLRDRATGDEPILLHVNMDAGHGGKSGRFRRFRETALMYAFLLTVAAETS
ncbi:MAG: S9 family peptidase [marine benthic group bacterium]|nr:S9 family peptidase [Gemmatimonadota bacterium]MCL7963687.1 S9 family peptidase [Candidatus Carthagonibacter metallireducens]MCL7958464.1 S9 family peptidase [Gemmatimonadota bacterium]MCL7967709.1 S9 family peptidase [Gemmatimonadota bacterium]MCL7973908.1 S9 family peptidase [Gemmatimonadota bacterium]